MKHQISCIIAATAVVLLLASISVAQEGKAEFSVAIGAPQRARVGSSLVVDITVTNVSNHTIYFDLWVPDSEGEFNFNIDVFNSQGELVSRTHYGKAVRREKAVPGEDQQPEVIFTGSHFAKYLAPRETFKEQANISKLFDLKPGVYTVKVSRSDFHEVPPPSVVPGSSEDSDLRKPVDPHTVPAAIPLPPRPKAIARSNTITVEVVP